MSTVMLVSDANNNLAPDEAFRGQASEVCSKLMQFKLERKIVIGRLKVA